MPKKYSLALEGHKTSITLEPVFWDLLCAEAKRKSVAINHLIATLDQERIQDLDLPNLSSYLRSHVVQELMLEITNLRSQKCVD